MFEKWCCIFGVVALLVLGGVVCFEKHEDSEVRKAALSALEAGADYETVNRIMDGSK